jgi:hypothetical protein
MFVSVLGDSVTRRSTLLTLLFLTIESDPEAIGLSKGPMDPADIGNRCAVMAGRDDRAYLHCAEQAQRPAAASHGHSGRLRFDERGGRDDGGTRRYPLQRR